MQHTLLRPTTMILFLLSVALLSPAYGQKKGKKTEAEKSEHYLDKVPLSGLTFRSIGPAFTSGRISDFAVHPDRPSTYYVATSSGGVWKTVNAGTTYEPIFDGQGSYSIGCITLDPHNPNVVWVGTGENNNQRSVAYGDGLYKSTDGGKSWKHMGLKKSEHIGKIIVHPDNSDVVYVAAIGPLWSSGGDRGVYKTTDGGENWEKILDISEHTGVNDLVMDPRNPEVLYAAAFQRRRHVFTYLGGGPESGLYKTTDGGENWQEVNNGLPEVDLGRIGLAISPADPEILYATVEAAQGKSGFFASTDRGASWQNRSSYVTSGNYYQELVADPKDPNTIYAMDTWMHYSTDGGRTFEMVGEITKHVDNHCMWIDPQDTHHWLVGCDGGIYETWDAASTWDFKANLPVTQFYKVEVDNSEPFYYIYGGTQDNFSMGGPSRTNTAHGIVNSDWFITHGGDGFESQIDPENPNIVYAQSQYGVLFRYDRASGEEVGIQPQPRKDEAAYRWNWDAPLELSNHSPTRLYFAANKLFRSDDRGNSWEVISDDLTRQLNRNELSVMDRIWSIDAVNKNRSTSPYGTIVAFSESPLDEELLYVGTDDGLVQVTEDGGESWTRIKDFPGVPDRTYVNMLLASQHDAKVIYACFNHHKYGDFRPYVYKSTDKGRSWTSITANLPERGSSYAIAEDHNDPNLLFVGTEFGVFFTNDGGKHWKQLKSGVPTIAVRDLAIQQRENDLVLGTFGRGFYVLDDYSPLRNMGKEALDQEALLYPVREALAYEEALPLGLPGKSFQGDNFYTGENLGPAAMFTIYLKDDLKSLQEQRREREKKMMEEGKDPAYPTYEELKAEREEEAPSLLLTVKDDQGKVVRKLTTSAQKGLQRVQWDLRYATTRPVRLKAPEHYNPWGAQYIGTLAEPGEYTVTLSKVQGGEVSELAGPVSFRVKALNNLTLPPRDRATKVAFQREVSELSRQMQATQRTLSELSTELRYMRKAIEMVEAPLPKLLTEIQLIQEKIRAVEERLNGDDEAGTLDMDVAPSVSSRIGHLMWAQFHSTSDPTQTHRDLVKIVREELAPLRQQVREIDEGVMEALRKKMEELKAPYTPGR